MIRSISQISDNLSHLRDFGVQRGDDTGFITLDSLYSIKQGFMTFILMPPGHGKTEFAIELALNQAIRFGKRTILNTPETGSIEDIVAELVHKVTGKSFFKSNQFHCDDKEYYSALNWIEQHFLILDTDDRSFSFTEMFEAADQWEKENKDEKIHLMIGDPYNELRHDMSTYGGRQDLYIEDAMGDVRRRCKKTKRHFILCLHPANQQIIIKDEIRYFPMPTAREAAGGQALLRKGFCWINGWRPPVGLLDENGQPYKENQLILTLEKVKPKGVGKKGTTSVFFDWQRNRYYEEHGSQHFYAFEHEKGYTEKKLSELLPNLSFDDAPF
jgi:hypothetical protein